MAIRKPPHGFDEQGKPIWALNGANKPMCGATRKGKICRSTKRCDNGRCRLHGGKVPTGPAHPGYRGKGRSKEDLTRAAILNSIANHRAKGDEQDLLDKAIEAIAFHISRKNYHAAQWFIDQLAGKADTRIQNVLSDDASMICFARALKRAKVPEETADLILEDAAELLHDYRAESAAEG